MPKSNLPLVTMASLQSARKFPGRIHGSAEVPGMEKFGEKVVKKCIYYKNNYISSI